MLQTISDVFVQIGGYVLARAHLPCFRCCAVPNTNILIPVRSKVRGGAVSSGSTPAHIEYGILLNGTAARIITFSYAEHPLVLDEGNLHQDGYAHCTLIARSEERRVG